VLKAAIVITAKGGNLSLKDKHLVPVLDRLLVQYPIDAAKAARLAVDVFLTTEDSRIREIGIASSLKIIDRPKELARPDTNHGDVMIHAAQYIRERHHPDLKIMTVLLGNTVMVDGAIIDKSIATVAENAEVDSAMTVWKAQDDHPLRAMTVGPDGYLRSYLSGATPDTNRQSYPDVFFYDQGPWTFRVSALDEGAKTRSGGPGPWWWMGKRSVALERSWITGRDVHTDMDIWMQESWVEATGAWKIESKRLGVSEKG
jgi:CMP-N-acetylneuraminic acid synthetase